MLSIIILLYLGTLELASTVRPKCKLDGCQRDCYVNDDGTVYDCCSRGHGRKYLEICQQQQQQTGQLPTAGTAEVLIFIDYLALY